MNHQTYAARWIFPIDAPPIERGTITIGHGQIVALEPHGTRSPDVELGNVAILPGFVNAHTHLDLTGARGVCPPTPDFTQWLRQVIAFRRRRSDVQTLTDIKTGIADCRAFGTTLIGDIAGALVPRWQFFADEHLKSGAPCRVVIFGELIGSGDHRMIAPPVFQEPTIHWGNSPHAPYSAGVGMYEFAARQPTPVATHLAESMEELELLNSRSGPFVEFLQELNVWKPECLVAKLTDIIELLPLGTFVHCNYLDPATQFLPTQSVVVCPRTHAAFGHPHHPFPKMKVRVALGTDSLASNPDLDILAEARFLRQHYPEVAPATILRMLTLNGAEALGFASVAGSLTPGKSADLVVLPLPDGDRSDPHDLILDSTLPVRNVMFRGEGDLRIDASRPT